MTADLSHYVLLTFRQSNVLCYLNKPIIGDVRIQRKQFLNWLPRLKITNGKWNIPQKTSASRRFRP